MIGPLSAPVTTIAPHARLIYSDTLTAKDAWSRWPENMQVIDRFIEGQPRLSLANSALYLYFFNGDQGALESQDKPVWVGREITGHVARPGSGLKVFDSFKSEIFSWELPQDQFSALTGTGLLQVGAQLRGLAGGALAETWRVVLDPLEPWSPSGDVHKELPQVTFQFYKKV